MEAIHCKGIKKIYGSGDSRTEALKGIDLDVQEGQLTLLVGPSGSGKTTLLSIITTILTPDEGELSLLGEYPNRLSSKEKAAFCRKNLGIVFQSLFLIPSLTVEENVSLPLLVAGEPMEKVKAKTGDTLTMLNLSHWISRSPAQLSKGQQQRVSIARAIVNDPKIIVCDEPTSALDHETGFEIMSILHDLALRAKKTVLVVTHDPRIFSFADRVIKMADGQIFADGRDE